MTDKERAIKAVLEENLISETTIRNFLGIGPKEAKGIFNLVKAKEIELYTLDSRKKAVPTDLFLKMRGISYENVKKRYERKQHEKTN